MEPKVSRIISIGSRVGFVFQAICPGWGAPYPSFLGEGVPWQGRETQLLPVSDASLDSRGRDCGRTEKSRNVCLPLLALPGCLRAVYSLPSFLRTLCSSAQHLALFWLTGRCRPDLGSPASLEGSLRVGRLELRAAFIPGLQTLAERHSSALNALKSL